MSSGKIPCVHETRPESHPGMTCTWKLAEFDISACFDGAEPGEKVELEFCELTQEEFDDLGEFDGW